ncbi:NUDIX domain-containing protein [Comamonas aquatilis]|uniref:NUDIX hydrolase n=1 Tax=Comamonas aquatilis TaxID=1778406 RepID=UPI0039EFF151
MNQASKLWLEQTRQAAQQPPLQTRQSLAVAGQVVGTMDGDLVRRLSSEQLRQHGLELVWSKSLWALQGEGDVTAVLNRMAQALREAGLCGAWRNEQLAVHNAQGLQVGTVERGAVRPLGIATQAVHLVGAAPDGRIWVQQRADNKATNPGMWDTLMGGMVSAADSLPQALERETWEEAGLRVADLTDLRHGGFVSFCRPSDEAEGHGYVSERIDWFEATVPESLSPDNQDGEVQRFELLERESVEDWLVQDRFTPEASLILAAYFGWR